MSLSPGEVRLRTRQAQDVLLGYLEDSLVPPWPGGDGLTLDDVLRDYATAIASGGVPDARTLRLHHPELAEALTSVLEHLRAAQAGDTACDCS
jgi:hypothetical protein